MARIIRFITVALYYGDTCVVPHLNQAPTFFMYHIESLVRGGVGDFLYTVTDIA